MSNSVNVKINLDEMQEEIYKTNREIGFLKAVNRIHDILVEEGIPLETRLKIINLEPEEKNYDRGEQQ